MVVWPSRRSQMSIVTVAACLGLAACATTPGPTNPVQNPNQSKVAVGMVTHGQANDPFWAQAKQGAEQAASDFNVDLRYSAPPTTDPQAQAQLITDAAGQKPAAMVVTIPDPAVLAGPIKQAADAGTPVIVANVGVNQLDQVGALTFVGQDDALAGQQAGTAMGQAGVNRAVCVIHEEQNTALTDRCSGFQQQLAMTGGTVAVVHVNGSDQQGAQTAIANALTQDPAVNGVLATGIQGFSAASAAITGLNAGGRVKLGTFDVSVENPDDLTAVQNGEALFVVDQQPFLQGYDAVQVAAFQARFGQHPFRPIYTGPSLVTTDNAAKVTSLYQGLGKQEQRISVAMVTHGQGFDPFWALIRKGAEQAASDFNVDLAYASPATTNPDEQAKLIIEAGGKNPAAMVVTIPDPGVLTAPIKQASGSGLPVVVMNIGATLLDQVGAITYVGQDETLAGQEAGTAMAQAGVTHGLCIIHEEQNIALTDRCNGFQQQLSSTGGTVTVLHVNGSQLHDAQQAVASELQQDPSINGVLATGLPGFSAAGGALQSQNAFGKVKLGSFDVSTTNLTAVQNGQAQFAVDQQPFLQGYDAVQVAAFQARFGQHPFRPIYTGPSLITKANSAQVLKLYQGNAPVLVQQGGYPS
ncbi:substrate-binding domain-containing protein [Pseudonocardia adelaidensis]|uniref:Periplasmic binding protein domain-containing protein n=1 Tax=Pseudonocardia adelaidensis TaxID=648754 RepID=A0ABP9P4T4_9PSEU